MAAIQVALIGLLLNICSGFAATPGPCCVDPKQFYKICHDTEADKCITANGDDTNPAPYVDGNPLQEWKFEAGLFAGYLTWYAIRSKSDESKVIARGGDGIYPVQLHTFSAHTYQRMNLIVAGSSCDIRLKSTSSFEIQLKNDDVYRSGAVAAAWVLGLTGTQCTVPNSGSTVIVVNPSECHDSVPVGVNIELMCREGHQPEGQPGVTNFTATCQADGHFDKDTHCVPIVPGALQEECMSLNSNSNKHAFMHRRHCYVIHKAQNYSQAEAASACSDIPEERAQGYLAIINSEHEWDSAELEIKAMNVPGNSYSRIATVRYPETDAKEDTNWFVQYNGDLFGPLPTKNQGYNKWCSPGTSHACPNQVDGNTAVLSFYNGGAQSSDVFALSDNQKNNVANIPTFAMCEYSSAADSETASFKKIPEATDKALNNGQLMETRKGLKISECIYECAKHVVCHAVGFNNEEAGTENKECRLYATDYELAVGTNQLVDAKGFIWLDQQ